MGLGSFSGHRAGFCPKIRFLLLDPGFRQWDVFSPRRYLRFGTFGLIFSGRSAARRVIFWPPGRIFARKSVFCYRTPDFVNGPFVTLCETVDLAPSDPFLNFSFPSYVNFREGENGDFRAGGHWEKLRSSETKRATTDRLVPKRPQFWWLRSRTF